MIPKVTKKKENDIVTPLEEEFFNIFDVIFLLWDKRKILILISSACVILTGIYSLFITPVYRIECQQDHTLFTILLPSAKIPRTCFQPLCQCIKIMQLPGDQVIDLAITFHYTIHGNQRCVKNNAALAFP